MVSRRAWNVQEIDNDLQQKDARPHEDRCAGTAWEMSCAGSGYCVWF